MPDSLVIIGTGLLGASIGLGLKATGYEGRIIGIGRRRDTLEAARACSAIDDFTLDDYAPLRDADVAVVAVPLGAFDAVLRAMAEHDHAGLAITDVGSTKTDVMHAAATHLPDPRRFIGAHPMAGSEHSGPEAASADLLRGKPCILTPPSDPDPDALAAVEALWHRLGMSLLRMTPIEHDRATASVSHLPHAAAVLLVHAAAGHGDDQAWAAASTGFRDTTRLASSNPPMRRDIMLANGDALIEALTTLRDGCDDLIARLDAGDADPLLTWLEAAKARRDAWLVGRDDL